MTLAHSSTPHLLTKETIPSLLKSMSSELCDKVFEMSTFMSVDSSRFMDVYDEVMTDHLCPDTLLPDLKTLIQALDELTPLEREDLKANVLSDSNKLDKSKEFVLESKSDSDVRSQMSKDLLALLHKNSNYDVNPDAKGSMSIKVGDYHLHDQEMRSSLIETEPRPLPLSQEEMEDRIKHPFDYVYVPPHPIPSHHGIPRPSFGAVAELSSFEFEGLSPILYSAGCNNGADVPNIVFQSSFLSLMQTRYGSLDSIPTHENEVRRESYIGKLHCVFS